MTPNGHVHIIGAGLAGLSAAIALRGHAHVTVHEATNGAGGRCRSYDDPQIGLRIDNGNHLVLSGNHAVMSYLDAIGSRETLIGPPHAEFPFMDLPTGLGWVVRPNDGRIPWWIASQGRRVPGTRMADYLDIGRIPFTTGDGPLASVLGCAGPFYERFLRPVLVAALNTEPAISSVELVRNVMRDSLAKGGLACRPLVAAQGLADAFVTPALAAIEAAGGDIRFGHRLRSLVFSEARVAGLDFGGDFVLLGPRDRVVLATPPGIAAELLPGLSVPENFNAIVNAHFAIAPPPDWPALTGVLNATTEWLFAFPDRLSVTISDANRLLDVHRETLARDIWAEVSTLTGLPASLPPWQIVREKRATFAATPAEQARRPLATTRWSNLALAGDWTATGLPATIEGAIRSGVSAASVVIAPKS